MEILNLSIVAAAASVLTQLLKTYLADGLPRALFAIGISVVLGIIAYVLNFLPALTEGLIGVVLISNIIYTTLVKNLIAKE